VTIRVLIASDQAIIRTRIAAVLAAHEDMAVVGEAADQLIAVRLAARHRPDVVVMEIRADPTHALRLLTNPAAPRPATIAVLTGFDAPDSIRCVLRDDLPGPPKDIGTTALVDAVRKASADDDDPRLGPSLKIGSDHSRRARRTRT
jgi:DNA-binding NarL/FixJ family response regulator